MYKVILITRETNEVFYFNDYEKAVEKFVIAFYNREYVRGYLYTKFDFAPIDEF